MVTENDRERLNEIIKYYDNQPHLEKFMSDHDKDDKHFLMYALILELIKGVSVPQFVAAIKRVEKLYQEFGKKGGE